MTSLKSVNIFTVSYYIILFFILRHDEFFCDVVMTWNYRKLPITSSSFRFCSCHGFRMTRPDVTIQITLAHENFSTMWTPVGRGAFRVQPDVFVEVAWVTKLSCADLTLERFVSCVSSKVDLKSVFTRVHLPAKHAQVPATL